MYLTEQQIWNVMQILAEYLEEEQTGVQNFEKSNWKFVLECN